MTRLLFSLFLLFLMVGCGNPQGSGCRFFSPVQTTHGIAPDFSLASLENPDQKIALSKVYAENPVLLVFWATWCPPCVEEIPVLNEWHDRYSSKGLKIISVNIQEPRDHLLKFLQEYPVKFPVWMDLEGETQALYGLVGLPVSVFLAKGGEIIYYGFGLPSQIEALLEKSAAGEAKKEIPV